MVEHQLRRRGLSDQRVLDAMVEVPRECFVPERRRTRAFFDQALEIGEGQTISQPWIVASTAALLELRGHERVLDVGTGSGYAAAVLSRLCREVITVERRPALAAWAAERLTRLGFEQVQVRVGDGALGALDYAPFGGILVSATAEGHLPPALLEQLEDGAALVCPVRRDGQERLVRFRDGSEEILTAVRFVPLVTDAPA